MYIAIVCIGAANKVEAIKVSTRSFFTFMNAMLNILNFTIPSDECKDPPSMTLGLTSALPNTGIC